MCQLSVNIGDKTSLNEHCHRPERVWPLATGISCTPGGFYGVGGRNWIGHAVIGVDPASVQGSKVRTLAKIVLRGSTTFWTLVKYEEKYYFWKNYEYA